MIHRLEAAGALGIVSLLVPPPGPQGWGVYKSSTTVAEKIPEVGELVPTKELNLFS